MHRHLNIKSDVLLVYLTTPCHLLNTLRMKGGDGVERKHTSALMLYIYCTPSTCFTSFCYTPFDLRSFSTISYFALSQSWFNALRLVYLQLCECFMGILFLIYVFLIHAHFSSNATKA